MKCSKCNNEIVGSVKFCSKCGERIVLGAKKEEDPKEYYTLLGVGYTATTDHIKKAFRELAHKYHPDKNNNDDRMFKKINEAWQVLGDPKKRADYDYSRKIGVNNTNQGGTTQTKNSSSSPRRQKSSWWSGNIGCLVWILIIGGGGLVSIFSEEDTSAPSSEPISATCVKSENDFSLGHGTVLKKSSFMNGYGELVIKNGTTQDAIAKLINTYSNKSVYAVYIKAGTNFTIDEIPDGIYKLAFSSGNDWNTTTKTFNKCPSYEVFDDILDYETSDTQYTVFELTLYGVVGGDAETSVINSADFGSY